MEQATEERIIQCYTATVSELYGLVCQWTGGRRALAEDIVQETYLRAVRVWRKKGLPDNPRAWLRKTARNLLIDHRRRAQPASLEEVSEIPPVEPADVLHAERRALAHTGLSRIKSGYSRLLTAFHLDGERVREIASQEGLTERAVEGRLRRARQAFRAALAPFLSGGDKS